MTYSKAIMIVVLLGSIFGSGETYAQSYFASENEKNVKRSLPLRLNLDSPASANGRVAYYGGPLQNYLNLAILDRTRDFITPFGASGMKPILGGRVELFSAVGGVYAPFRTLNAKPNTWLAQASAGARVALDSGHHVWLGTTGRYLVDFADKKKQRAYGTADLSLQFGQ